MIPAEVRREFHVLAELPLHTGDEAALFTQRTIVVTQIKVGFLVQLDVGINGETIIIITIHILVIPHPVIFGTQ